MEKKLQNKYLGKWHTGHIALFGAILMSHGIRGKDKEFLKKLMYQALTTSKSK
jgi:hypothetical protein